MFPKPIMMYAEPATPAALYESEAVFSAEGRGNGISVGELGMLSHMGSGGLVIHSGNAPGEMVK